MATGATGQLGLALPVQGELSGSWGNTVNNGITEYTNIAIAATLTLTNDGAVTLANTTGDASASNITSSLTGAGTVTAQFAIVKVTGTLTTAKVITAPSYSKTYVVVNAATGGTVTFKASGQTGVSIAVGESAWVYYNGTDYVKIVGTATAGAAGGSTTQVQYNSSGSLAGSSNLTFDGTNLTLGGGTANGVTYLNGSKVLTSGSALTFDGNTLVQKGAVSTSSVIKLFNNNQSTSGFWLGQGWSSGTDNVAYLLNTANADFVFATNNAEQMRLTSTGLGIGTSSPTYPLTVGDSTAPTGLTPISVMISTNTSSGQVLNVRKSCDTALGSSISLMKSRGTAASPVVANVGDTAGGVIYSAFAGTNYRQLASINGVVEAYVSDTNISGYLVFNTNSASTGTAEKMRLDSSGNLGIGVTPSAWSGATALQVGSYAFVYTNNTAGSAEFSSNAYKSGSSTWTYLNSNSATRYRQQDGAHSWLTAASGTAGNAITFTQALTLDASGNLLVGGTSSVIGKLEVSVTDTSASADGINIRGTQNNAYGGYLSWSDTWNGDSYRGKIAAILGYREDVGKGQLKFFTYGSSALTERARIDSAGNLLLGVTSSTGLTGTGDFAMPNNRAIRFRNAANSAYLNMIYVDSSDNLNFGYGGVPTTITFGINGIGEVSRFTSAGGFSVGTTANPGAGAIYATGNITAYYSSDIKFKENVRDIPDALATVNAIGGKLFDWTDEYIESKGGADGYFVQKADFGVIAQDVQKVFPIAVRTRPDGSLAVDYEKLGALAFAALVELTKRVEALEAK